MRYKITVYKLDSKGKERIVDCQVFNNRTDADNFLDKHPSEIKPYKIQDKNSYHILEGL